MHLPDKSKVSKYQNLKQAAKSGAAIPELEGPPMPEGAGYLWNLWLEMQHEREHSFSIQGLKVRDIIGYANAYRLDLIPFEIDVLLSIDREFIAAHGHSKSKNKGR